MTTSGRRLGTRYRVESISQGGGALAQGGIADAGERQVVQGAAPVDRPAFTSQIHLGELGMSRWKASVARQPKQSLRPGGVLGDAPAPAPPMEPPELVGCKPIAERARFPPQLDRPATAARSAFAELIGTRQRVHRIGLP